MGNKRGLIFLVVGLVLLSVFGLTKLALADEASLFLSPASESFLVGETFSVEVMVDTGDTFINAAHAHINFPSEKLKVSSISKENSIFTLWPEEPTVSDSVEKEYVYFSGGLPQPGFNGTGKIVTIHFEAKEEGSVNLSLCEASVLACDGKGTDILTFIKEAKYSIQGKTSLAKLEPNILSGQIPPAPQIFSSTHPQQEEWYNNDSLELQWKLIPEITEISFTLDNNPDTVPDTEPETRVESRIYESIGDGTWYFHLRLANKEGWGPTTHYRFQVDTSPPHPFEVVIDNAGDPTNPNPDLYFETNDDISGIGYYKFRIGDERFSKLMVAQVNPFSLLHLSPGEHSIIVRAADQAGNNVETKTIIGIEPIATPQINLWPEFHISGEEVLYIEGKTLPEVEIMIFLKREGEEIKKWQAAADTQGEWSFSTKELLKSGTYYLSVQAKDKRGALSNISDGQKMEVSLSGLNLGVFMVSFKILALTLFLIVFIGIIIAGYFIFRARKTKKVLRKETQEAKESLHEVFDKLREEIKKQIELLDSQPGFSEEEKRIYKELEQSLDKSEESIRREIKDVERELY
jgi:hypothetical protein